MVRLESLSKACERLKRFQRTIETIHRFNLRLDPIRAHPGNPWLVEQ